MNDALPDQGRPAADILRQLHDFGAHDPDYKGARLWSLVYWLDDEYADFLGQAYQAYSSANGLNPSAFKSLKRFENEIIAATAAAAARPPETCGVVTSGGTESCLLAVKTYRDLARATRGVRRPEMVVPTTAHVAWFKAAEYFGVKLRRLPLDHKLHADVSRLDALINRHTVMVLGSAPEYPHGSIDPIEAMGAVAQKRGVPLHVDACVGGFILPFMAMNGVALPPWDYRVPGVSSISADLHKYGFAAKGASTITYRNLELLKHQMFVCEDWPGGVFASPALLGTRPGRRLCRGLGGDAALRRRRLPRPGRAHQPGLRAHARRHRSHSRAEGAGRAAGPAARLRLDATRRSTSSPSATRWTRRAGRSTGCSSRTGCTR